MSIENLGGFVGGARTTSQQTQQSWNELAVNFASITKRANQGDVQVLRYTYTGRAALYRRISSSADAFFENEDGSGTAVATRGML